MSKKLGDYDLPLDAILVKVRGFDTAAKPDLAGYKSVKLYEGTRAFRVATYWTIRDRHTGQDHHHTLTLRTFRRFKQRGWEEDKGHGITLTDDDGADEIQKLFNFLVSVSDVNGDGEYVIVNADNLDHRLGEVLSAVSSSDRSLQLLSQILSWANSDARANLGLIKLSSEDPDRSKSLVAALNYGRYAKALAELKKMVEDDLPERRFQAFLEENYWMFGSEYSQLIDKRTLTLGAQLDFPLRCTVDGYLDIIEIKTPLNGKALFAPDRDHDNLYAGRELSKSVAQARKYLTMLEADKFRIELQEKLKVDKVRAKVVIGRDGDEEQIQALRSFNADQNRVEVITYDQLIRIAERILEIMADENPLLVGLSMEEDAPPEETQWEEIGDVPF